MTAFQLQMEHVITIFRRKHVPSKLQTLILMKLNKPALQHRLPDLHLQCIISVLLKSIVGPDVKIFLVLSFMQTAQDQSREMAITTQQIPSLAHIVIMTLRSKPVMNNQADYIPTTHRLLVHHQGFIICHLLPI